MDDNFFTIHLVTIEMLFMHMGLFIESAKVWIMNYDKFWFRYNINDIFLMSNGIIIKK